MLTTRGGTGVEAVLRALRLHDRRPSPRRDQARTRRRPRRVDPGLPALTGGAGAVELRLPYRAPCDVAGARAVLRRPRRRRRRGGRRRRLSPQRPPAGRSRASSRSDPASRRDDVEAKFWLQDRGDLDAAVAACRRLLDLDTEPAADRRRARRRRADRGDRTGGSRPQGARRRRPRRARDPRRARAAGLAGRRRDARGAARERIRRAARAARRVGDASVPVGRGAGRRRPRTAGDALVAPAGADRPRGCAGRRRDRPRHGAMPADETRAAAARAAGDRAVDGRVHRDARAARSRRVHAHGPRRAARSGAARPRRPTAERRAHRRALASVPCVRDAAPVGPARLADLTRRERSPFYARDDNHE